MEVKTYPATPLKVALEDIKQELGPHAFILDQDLLQKTPAADHSRPAASVIDFGRSRTHRHVKPTNDDPRLLDEVRKLHTLVQSITMDRERNVVWLPRFSSSPAGRDIYVKLVAQGVDQNLACSLTSSPDVSMNTVSKNLLSRISIYPDFLRNPAGGSPEVMAVVGPTGAGKTTTVAKLAALAAFQNNLSVGLVTMDTFRIAAIEQLKTYGEIMGIPVRAVETMKDLRSAIKFFADRDVILIDTTGRNHCEVSQNWELAEFIAHSPEIRTAIVASARTPASDLAGIVDTYRSFKPNCVIFTKLDETEEHGSIVSELVRSELPLAYVTTGQSVFKDILKPDLRPLIDLALGAKRTKAWDALAQPVRSRLGPKRKEAKRSGPHPLPS